MYRATMHFNAGAPVEFFAEEPEIPVDLPDTEGGLRKHTLKALGGDSPLVYFDPEKLNAITVVPNEEWRPIPEAPGEFGEKVEESRLVLKAAEEVEVPSVSEASADSPKKDRPRPMADVLDFLSRFVVATVDQLERTRMERNWRVCRLRWGAETKRHLHVRWPTRVRLEAMRQNGLIRIDDPFYHRQNESVCVATDRGMARVGMDALPPITPEELAHGYGQLLRTVDLYLAVMFGTKEDAVWITSRELMSEKIRTAREKVLGRSLPVSVPSAHKKWPATPEAVLVLKERNLVAAIGLELLQVSKARLAAYETILDRYSRDPTLDRACFFFAHYDALECVRDLAQRYRRDDFFYFYEFPDGKREKITL